MSVINSTYIILPYIIIPYVVQSIWRFGYTLLFQDKLKTHELKTNSYTTQPVHYLAIELRTILFPLIYSMIPQGSKSIGFNTLYFCV